jgi:pimeloyl-ACP methyl ester carboxylesterase/DNA-binding winged helix-turn-helix (wHTH) protein
MTFGPFELDPVSGHLYRDGTPVPLPPKAFAVLQYLAENAGRLVSKRELLEAAWPGVFVGDAVLKVTIGEIRKALGDNPATPAYIETVHRRGYRFLRRNDEGRTSNVEGNLKAGSPKAGSLTAGSLKDGSLKDGRTPAVHYARSGDVNIAYQVVGSGRIDLVFVMGWVSHLEYFWNEPSFARFLHRLASMGRLILFDKRGTGMSDPVATHQLPTLEQRLDDVRAVMDAAGSTSAVLVGVSEGGPLCSLFAATHPEKTEALIMIGSYARRLRAPGYPWGPTREERDAFCHQLLDEWGGPVGIEERAPSMAHDLVFRNWWASYLRMGSSPGAAVALARMNAEIDVRALLPSIRVPTLVLHRRGDRCLNVEEGRYLASHIPGATFVELPGEDHLPFVGDQEAILQEIERFLPSRQTQEPARRVLASVMTAFCAPEERQRVRPAFERCVLQYRGRSMGEDRLAALFDGPARAVWCAEAVIQAAAAAGLTCGAGVHIGECDPTQPADPVVEASWQLAAAAGAGRVRVSRTIVDLVPGSGLEFTPAEGADSFFLTSSS